MADFLEDDGTHDHHFGHQEWDKLEENFVNAGYREGITTGKEEALQEGFDQGFATYGAPLGRDIGNLRGVTAALLVYLTKGDAHGPVDGTKTNVWVAEVRALLGNLAKLSMVALLKPDIEAIEHAKEHTEPSASASTGKDANFVEAKRANDSWEERKAELEGLRARVQELLIEIGFGSLAV